MGKVFRENTCLSKVGLQCKLRNKNDTIKIKTNPILIISLSEIHQTLTIISLIFVILRFRSFVNKDIYISVIILHSIACGGHKERQPRSTCVRALEMGIYGTDGQFMAPHILNQKQACYRSDRSKFPALLLFPRELPKVHKLSVRQRKEEPVL